MLAFVVTPVSAQVDYRQIAVITGPNVPPNGPWMFDLGWVDPTTRTYVLSDGTNSTLDIVDAQQDRYVGEVSGFNGGPNGVLIDDAGYAWAGDGNSNLQVVDLHRRKIVATINTGGSGNADELGFDPRDHLVLITNPEEVTPFVTLVSTTTRKIVGRIDLTGALPQAEQPTWDPGTGLFYLPVQGSTSMPGSYLQAVDPVKKKAVKTIPLGCLGSQGTALGPSDQLIATCFSTGAAIVDLAAGKLITHVAGTTGEADEATYDPTERTYYLAGATSMLVVDAVSKKLIASVTTRPDSHSIAVNPLNNHVFVPISGTGIAVYQRVSTAQSPAKPRSSPSTAGGTPKRAAPSATTLPDTL